MATLSFIRMRSIATSMLNKFGTSAVITSRESGTLKGKAVLVNSTTSTDGGDDTNSKTVYFQGTDKEPAPAPGDLVTIHSDNWGITSVQDINPDGKTTVLFKLQVTK